MSAHCWLHFSLPVLPWTFPPVCFSTKTEQFPKRAYTGVILHLLVTLVMDSPPGNQSPRAPPALRSQSSCLRNALDHLKGLLLKATLPDNQMSTAALKGEPIWGWQFGCIASFRNGSIVRFRPTNGGYARVGWAQVEILHCVSSPH